MESEYPVHLGIAVRSYRFRLFSVWQKTTGGHAIPQRHSALCFPYFVSNVYDGLNWRGAAGTPYFIRV